MSKEVPDLQERLTLVRAYMLKHMPFWGMLAWKLPVVEDPSVKTAATEGKTLRFNPEFAARLSNQDLAFVYAHEIGHCAMGHIFRQGTRTLRKWQYACDYALNPMLMDSGLKMPTGENAGLYEKQFHGMSAEQVYEKIPEPPQSGGGGFNDPGTHMTSPTKGSGPGEGQPMSQAELKQLEDEWKQATQQALMAAKGRGKLPGGLSKLIDDTLAPKVNWRAELAQFMQATLKTDYDWSFPNKRYIPLGVYMPAVRSRAINLAVLVIDSSGSTMGDLSRFCSEITSLLREVNPRKTLVIWCDSAIQKVEELDDVTDWNPKAKGFGGTSFKPPFAFLEKECLEPDVMVYYTDLDGDFPTQAPSYPVLWASSTGMREVPFGRCLQVDRYSH